MTAITLSASIYTHYRGAEYKTCPGCSVAAGKHVWLEVSEFGQRKDGDGVYVQSHCGKCRSAANRRNA